MLLVFLKGKNGKMSSAHANDLIHDTNVFQMTLTDGFLTNPVSFPVITRGIVPRIRPYVDLCAVFIPEVVWFALVPTSIIDGISVAPLKI